MFLIFIFYVFFTQTFHEIISMKVASFAAPKHNEWKPRHMHEVVGVTLMLRQWMKSKNRMIGERQKTESELAIREVNSSLVFEPMAITMGRLHAIEQQQKQQMPSAAGNEEQQQKEQAVQAAANQPPIQQLKKSGNRIGPMTTEQQHLQNGSTVGRPNGGGRHHHPTPMAQDTDEGIIVYCSVRKFRTTLRDFPSKIRTLLGTAIDPAGLFYCYWTLLVYAVFLYNAIVSVLFVFDDTQSEQRTFAAWMTLNAFGDLINLTDIFFNSRLSYLEDGMTVANLKRLAKRYCRRCLRNVNKYWLHQLGAPHFLLDSFSPFRLHFLFDLVALVPTDLLLLLNPNLSLVRFNRLAKCYRAVQLVQMTNVRTNYPNAFRILHILVTCAVLFHWNAAVYFKISLINGIFSLDLAAWEFNYVKNQDPIWADCITVLLSTDDGQNECMFNETSRGDPDIERINYTPELAEFWQNRSTKMAFSNFSKQYSLSFYWSSLTLTTSGQQPYPTAAMHNFLEIFDTIVGVLVFAVIVGSVGNAVSTMNLTLSELQQLNDGIKFYMNYRNVTDAMQKRVLDCIHYIRRHAQMQDERAIMGSTLPARLRGELAVHLHFETISRVELFAHCETSLLYELVLRFKMQMFAPNDFLCRRGDLAREMFVLKRGVLEVIDENGALERLESGATFGEMSILKPIGQLGKLLARRRLSLRSLGYSEVYLLSQEDALNVFADYPEQRQMLVNRASQLLLERGEVGGTELAEPGPLDPLELCGTESGGELLQLLGNSLCGLDHTLESLYDKFTMTSAEFKQQITVLEGKYQRNRLKLRKQRQIKLCQK